MRNTRKNSGITLIALVITIIVLLILAGVAVYQLTGGNILDNAQVAVDRYNDKAGQEDELITQLDELLSQYAGEGNPPATKPGESGYEGGRFDDPYIPIGFTHTGSEDWNHGYMITGNTGTEYEGDQFVWVPCTTDTTNTTLTQFARITNDSVYNSYSMTGLGDLEQKIVVEEKSIGVIENSITNYGGFYIARFEAGVPTDEEGNEIVSTYDSPISDFTKKPRSVQNATAWTYITRENAITAAQNMINYSNTGVHSVLISGVCYDTTLQWIANTEDGEGNRIYNGYDVNPSVENGYFGEDFVKTGSNSNYAVNNIYDMAGNVCELTTEFSEDFGETCPIQRGMGSRVASQPIPPAERYVYMDQVSDDLSFRVVIYK